LLIVNISEAAAVLPVALVKDRLLGITISVDDAGAELTADVTRTVCSENPLIPSELAFAAGTRQTVQSASRQTKDHGVGITDFLFIQLLFSFADFLQAGGGRFREVLLVHLETHLTCDDATLQQKQSTVNQRIYLGDF
jgi:hypothetical protein